MPITATRPAWRSANPDYKQRIAEAFRANRAIALLGAELGVVEPGHVEIRMPIGADHVSHIAGVTHGGTLAMIADSALGFAALSLVEPEVNGVTAEYKISFLAPATGELAIARAEVVKPGRITVARAEVWDLLGGEERLVATALGTLVALQAEAPTAAPTPAEGAR